MLQNAESNMFPVWSYWYINFGLFLGVDCCSNGLIWIESQDMKLSPFNPFELTSYQMPFAPLEETISIPECPLGLRILEDIHRRVDRERGVGDKWFLAHNLCRPIHCNRR